jgi:hypothetical protein
VGSKVRDDDDRIFIEDGSLDLPVLGHLADDPRVRQADRQGDAVYYLAPELAKTSQEIVLALEEVKAKPHQP